MRWSIVLPIVVSGALPGIADEPTEWKEFVSKEGGFRVLLAGRPKQYKLDTESDFGKGVLNMNSIKVGKTMYAANYCDFPAEIKKADLKQVYDSSRDGAVGNLEGKLAGEKDIKLGQHSGREIRIEVDGGKQLFRVRLYLVDQRLYQVVVFGTKEAAVSKDAERFLDSFQLAGK